MTTSDRYKLDPDRIRRIAAAQKLVMWALLANIVGLLILPLLILALPLMLFAVNRLVKSMSDRPDRATAPAILAMIAMFIPIVSLIVLVVLSSKATSMLQLNGVRVGFMGAKEADLPKAA